MASKKAKETAKPDGGAATAPKSFGKTLVAMVLMTVLAAAGGGLYTIEILPAVKGMVPDKAKAGPAATASSLPPNTTVKDLPPIVTNIVAPDQAWIRLEAAVIYDGKAVPQPDVLMREIGEDVLAFLRTVTLEQIQGVGGLRQLREDLNERVAIRSQGKARELLIQALIVQ